MPVIVTVPFFLSAGYLDGASVFVCRLLDQFLAICMPVIGIVSLSLYAGYWNCSS